MCVLLQRLKSSCRPATCDHLRQIPAELLGATLWRCWKCENRGQFAPAPLAWWAPPAKQQTATALTSGSFQIDERPAEAAAACKVLFYTVSTQAGTNSTEIACPSQVSRNDTSTLNLALSASGSCLSKVQRLVPFRHGLVAAGVSHVTLGAGAPASTSLPGLISSSYKVPQYPYSSLQLPPKPAEAALVRDQPCPSRGGFTTTAGAGQSADPSRSGSLLAREAVRGRTQKPPSRGLLPILLISQRPANDGPAPALPQDPDHPPTAPRRCCLVCFVRFWTRIGRCIARMHPMHRRPVQSSDPEHDLRTPGESFVGPKGPVDPQPPTTMSHRVPGSAKAYDVLLQMWHAVISGGWAGLGPVPPTSDGNSAKVASFSERASGAAPSTVTGQA